MYAARGGAGGPAEYTPELKRSYRRHSKTNTSPHFKGTATRKKKYAKNTSKLTSPNVIHVVGEEVKGFNAHLLLSLAHSDVFKWYLFLYSNLTASLPRSPKYPGRIYCMSSSKCFIITYTPYEGNTLQQGVSLARHYKKKLSK